MELQPKSAPEEEAFLRVWQRVSAPTSAPPPPPSPQSWDEAGFLAAAMDDTSQRMALCQGMLCRWRGVLTEHQRRLGALYYLLTGQRHVPAPGGVQRDMTPGQRCRELYRRSLTAGAACAAAGEESTQRRQLYRAMAAENRRMAEQVLQAVEGMLG